MRRSFINRFAKNESAAIAPMYALGIGTLVVMSAVGFDYGRLMALDTELQNAADQAALAAATQLDGTDNAMINARDAGYAAFVRAGATAGRNLVSETRFANDGAGRPITNLSYRFFDGYEDDAMGDLITDDDEGANAAVVEVTVNARRVFYALTPLVGAFTSGDVIGRALAGIENAQCEVAPMFFCVPKEGGVNVLDFPRSSDAGKQLRLHVRNNNAETVTPGNFGFLDIPYGDPSEKNKRLGLNASAEDCFEAKPDEDTEPGHRTTMGESLNSRLDLFKGSINASACNGQGDFCPSENATKDWVNVQITNNTRTPGAVTCANNPRTVDWERFNATTGTPNPGYPDDSAFTGILGNGTWGPTGYMTTNHSAYSVSDIPDENGNGSISRYETHLWELSNPGTLLQPRAVRRVQVPLTGGRFRVTLYCAYPSPVEADAWPATTDQKDRRILTAGAVACEDGYPNGVKPVKILKWVDLFITRPINSSSETEFLTEVIGPARRADGGSGIQFFSRKKAVLIR